MKTRLLFACALLSGSLLHAQTGKVGIGTTNPQAGLHTVGSVRHDTLAGAGGRLFYADSAGRIFTPRLAPTNTTEPLIYDNMCGMGFGAFSAYPREAGGSNGRIAVMQSIVSCRNFRIKPGALALI